MSALPTESRLRKLTVPEPVLEVLQTGLGASFQDLGRSGWKRFGVPPGGAMDRGSARIANRLANNDANAPVIELLMQGAEFRVLSTCRIAITGADASGPFLWQSAIFAPGQVISFPNNRSGVWTYVAVEGGFRARRILGSASANVRAGIGRNLIAGEVLQRSVRPMLLNANAVEYQSRADLLSPFAIPVHAGPQWDQFSDEAKHLLFESPWQVAPRSDRSGYRLSGPALSVPAGEMTSEPVIVGSIQVPPDGAPIVTMRDGPTVGGYPKIAVVDPAALDELSQIRPGINFQFQAAS